MSVLQHFERSILRFYAWMDAYPAIPLGMIGLLLLLGWLNHRAQDGDGNG